MNYLKFKKSKFYNSETIISILKLYPILIIFLYILIRYFLKILKINKKLMLKYRRLFFKIKIFF
jgi:hypothetical protein